MIVDMVFCAFLRSCSIADMVIALACGVCCLFMRLSLSRTLSCELSNFFGIGGFLVTASDEMTMNLKRKWFEAVLRQDMAYFDLQDVSGTSTIISTNGAKYKKGVSKKLGSGVQFTCMVLVRGPI